MDRHVISFERSDQIEVGSAPLETKDGWLVFYSYIYNYFSPPPIFASGGATRSQSPQKIVGEVKRPFILLPQEEYGFWPRARVVFPRGVHTGG